MPIRSHGTGARMNASFRNVLIVVLVVAVGVLGYLYYQQRQRENQVQINLGNSSLTIRKN
jgi:lipopolysaccharide export system protein LptC